MYAAVINKQWQEIRDRIWTYPLVALFLSVISQQADSVLIAIIGAFLVLDMAVQAAGDDVRWGTFEFIFTRAVDRRKYFTLKFLFGLIPLAGLILLYIVFDAVDVHRLFWTLVSEPVEPFLEQFDGGAGFYLLVGLVLLLLYAVVYFFCSTATRESAFSGFLVAGFIVTFIYSLVCAWAVTDFIVNDVPAVSTADESYIHLAEGSPRDGSESFETYEASAGSPSPLRYLRYSEFVFYMSILMLLPAVILFFAGREHYARCELPKTVAGGVGSSTAIYWVILVLLVLFVIMMLTRVDDPSDEPATPTQIQNQESGD